MSSAQAAAVELFSTSILSNHKIRSRHERYVSILAVKKIPYIYHDLAGDEKAKSRWRRKARDPQIPGLLVHNEWRGTFEEFEESVEFGELDLFLKVDEKRTQVEADAGLAPSLPDMNASASTPSVVSNGGLEAPITRAKSATRASSHTVAPLPRLAQPRAPSQNNLAPALPFAPSGSGSRKEHDAESFLSSLGISDLTLTEEELNEILEEGKPDEKLSFAGEIEGTGSNGSGKGQGKYPTSLGKGTSKPAPPRMYIPSADAGVKPLRLARMGDGVQSSSSSSTSPLRSLPSARFNPSQLSSKALAAEAQASISSRSFSSVRLREAVSRGDVLKDAFQATRGASDTDRKETVVGREDLDELMASLGLGDVKMSEEEADAFLLDGTIPTGLDSDGPRLGRSGSDGEKARNEAAARDVAKRAKEKGHGSASSRPSSTSSIQTPELQGQEESREDVAAVASSPVEPELKKPLEFDEKTPASDVEVLSDMKGDDASGNGSGAPLDTTPKQNETSLPPASHDSALIDASSKGGASLDSTIEREAKDGPEKGEVPPTVSDGKVTQAKVDAEASMEREEARDMEDISVELSPITGSSTTNSIGKAAESLSAPVEIEEKASAAEVAFHYTPEEPVSAAEEETKVAPTEASRAPESLDVVEKQDASKPLTTTAKTPSPQLEDSISAFADMIDFDGFADSQILSSPPAPAPPSKATPSRLIIDQGVKSPTTTAAIISPSTSRTQVRSPNGTPSRKGIDVPRSMSSTSSFHATTSTPRSQSNNDLGSPRSPGIASPIGSEGMKSPKSASKKFFSIGRRKAGMSSSSSNGKGRKGDASDSEEDYVSSPPLSALTHSNSQDRNQKTLSMILKEADAAMLEMEGEEEGKGGGRGRSDNAFDYDLDDLDENDGIEVATR
ncbi:hypothetical protein CBS101457_002635 [Exobasidium rhododendri]|nr:hypothetical protein CBS101457_002635 [Exobasidium rhododendri]